MTPARWSISLASRSRPGDGRSRQKQQILDSRINATRSLVDAVRRIGRGTFTLINASAVGYYGPLGDELVTEDHSAGSDFLAGVCVAWEAEAGGAASAARVVCVRTGLVLDRDGGALPPMLPPFKFGAGGPVGSGRQYWPWIHRDDWIALVRWAIETSSVSGPVNATAPNPVTNAEFARALGRALHRPAFMPAPGFALRLMLGEMADALLLSGQRAIPAKARASGLPFPLSRIGRRPRRPVPSEIVNLWTSERQYAARLAQRVGDLVGVRQVGLLEHVRERACVSGYVTRSTGASSRSNRSSMMTADSSAPIPSVFTSSCTISDAARLFDRPKDRVLVERQERPQVDHLDLDALLEPSDRPLRATA